MIGPLTITTEQHRVLKAVRDGLPLNCDWKVDFYLETHGLIQVTPFRDGQAPARYYELTPAGQAAIDAQEEG